VIYGGYTLRVSGEGLTDRASLPISAEIDPRLSAWAGEWDEGQNVVLGLALGDGPMKSKQSGNFVAKS